MTTTTRAALVAALSAVSIGALSHSALADSHPALVATYSAAMTAVTLFLTVRVWRDRQATK